ncbi:hypothetical protein AB0F77_02020 [Streptomyces sp. NPDC026672]|uniref:hypothetical protein n=1 Tax=unclassified Streptomyces TaxID=2593676 RepID=UPI0033DC25EF
MSSSDLPLIVSPVGADTDLRAALEDLRIGRYHATRDLLSRTGGNWALRTSRSRLLAVGAGEGGVFKTWVDEEPTSADAWMMWGRVLTRAALTAHRGGRGEGLVARAVVMARDACWKAASLLPECPVPWVCLLHLTQLPFDARYFDPHVRSHREPWNRLDDPTMIHEGPWPLLAEINWRHPGNREGHHRMREALWHRGKPGAAMNYSCWEAAGPQTNPELLMLPIYALMDIYRQRHGGGHGAALRFWQDDGPASHARRARDGWFAKIPPVQHAWLSLPDLNHLAHALVACGEDARAVFLAMGPYATPEPWQDINTSLGRSYDWTTEFLRVRTSALR